jgi:hypothetical protein
MLRADYHRVPRSCAQCKDVLTAAQNTNIPRAAKNRMVEGLSLWPEGSALHGLRLCNPYLQVRGDSLHVLDGGLTARLVLLAGNWLYSEGGWDEVCR